MSFRGLSFPSNKGNHRVAAYRLPADPEIMISFQYKQTVDPATTPEESRRYKYICIACDRSKEQGTRCTVQVFFPKADQCEFLTDPADPDRHKCDWHSDEKCRSVNVLSSKIAKSMSVENAEYAQRGHVKKPARVQKEGNATIVNRLGNLQDIIQINEVQEVLDLYSGGENKRKRKRQIAADLRRSCGSMSAGAYDEIDDADLLVLGTNESLRVSDSDDTKRIYLASHRLLKWAIDGGIEALLVDGNFSFTPTPSLPKKLAYQLYTVRVCTRRTSFLLMAALLPSKTAKEYSKLLEKLAEMFQSFNHSLRGIRIVSDWETGIIKAIRDTLPMLIHEGCLFHALKCTNHKLSQFGLKVAGKSYPIIREWTDRVRASFFLPRYYFRSAKILEVPVTPAHSQYAACKNFLEYFQDEWMSRPETMTCKFMVESHRTSNLVEAWHRGAMSHFLGTHPPLMELVKFIQETELDDYNSLRHYVVKNEYFEKSKTSKERSAQTLAPMIGFDAVIAHRDTLIEDPTVDEILAYLDKMVAFCHELTC